MAAVATPISCSLQVIVETGRDENDRIITRTRSYTRVKPGASDNDILATGTWLAGLQEHPLNALRKVVVSDLVEEG